MTQAMSARRQFVKAAMAAPYLTREEEHELAVRWRETQDQAALHRMTSAHMRLVIALASRFRHFGLSMNDLIQEVAPNYFSTGEQQEGASAFLEKRKPDFSKFR